PACSLTLPDKPYEEQPQPDSPALSALESESATPNNSLPKPPADLVSGLAALREHPVLVMGVASDILFPAWQQAEVAQALREAGNEKVEHHELSEGHSLFVHDTFLFDVGWFGGAVKAFLG